MPFAGFKDFQACVAANQDKGNPEAYCAFIENKTKAEELMADFADKTLINVPIFESGHLKDSLGNERDFTDKDISDIIEAFSQGAPPSVPIKIGHSSDAFNVKVANSLGIPKELVTGEGPLGKGQVRLGEITGVKQSKDGKLLADMRVSEPVADLIKDGLLIGLSAELQFNRKQGDKTHPTVLSGLAFLGAQRAALSDLPSLQEATMLEDGTHADSVYFSDKIDLTSPSDATFESGSTMLPNGEVTSPGSGTQQVYTVPVNDLTRGRQVFASVSAPNEITAKRTALRVVENFLFSLGGPLGTALGVTGGAILSARLITGKPILGGIKGLLRWKFEEPFDLGSEVLELNEFIERATRLIGKGKEIKNVDITRYAEHPDMASCIAKAKADGVADPEVFCRNKFDEEAATTLAELAKSLSLSEWDSAGILVKMKELMVSKEEGSKFEEETNKKMDGLLHDNRVFYFQEETIKLTLIPGTPKENAEKLATLEGKAGAETATMMLESWQAQEKSAQEAKVSKAVLKPGHDLEEGEFSEAVTKYQEEHEGTSKADAIKATMRSNAELASNRNNTN